MLVVYVVKTVFPFYKFMATICYIILTDTYKPKMRNEYCTSFVSPVVDVFHNEQNKVLD